MYLVIYMFNKIVAKEYYQKMRQNLILFINKLLRANGGCLDCKRR
jgi:hypothetical protein